MTDAHNSKVWLKQPSHRTEPEGGEKVHQEQECSGAKGRGRGREWVRDTQNKNQRGREARGECADAAFLV